MRTDRDTEIREGRGEKEKNTLNCMRHRHMEPEGRGGEDAGRVELALRALTCTALLNALTCTALLLLY